MDSYELFWRIKTIWMDNTDKQSGLGPKNTQHMATMIMTKDGYREVIGAKWNSEIRAIELITDEE
jgi:hypothetical protein